MTKRQTQNLRDNGDTWIYYHYYFNQMTDIEYPEHPENNVHYEYGAPNNPNHVNAKAVGRLYFMEDATGFQQFSYDKLGNVNENIRTFVLPNEDYSYTFKMQYNYDTYGRMKEMAWPDGEVVSYDYNSAGDLFAMTGQKGSESFKYINEIYYNKFGQKTAIGYGNQTKVEYYYDNLQRLAGLVSYTAQNEIMQNIEYSYDPVSNIRAITNSASPLSNGLGESYQYDYVYDELYRLIRSQGTYYGLEVDYSPNGKIEHKTLGATYNFNGNVYNDHYSHDYNYYGGSNRLNDINGGLHYFEWDGNGNMTYHKNSHASTNRYLCWDEENRLMAFKDEKTFGYYAYNAGGTRTYKLSGDMGSLNVNGQWYGYPMANNITLYASPYLVATHKGYTKHYYAGNDRICSKLGGGGIEEIYNPIKNTGDKHNLLKEQYYKLFYECLNSFIPVHIEEYSLSNYNFHEVQNDEKDLYFYHSDHLGSASWITDAAGSAIQHLQYTPFGEPRLDQRTIAWNTMFSFSGKERDTESSYSYFGARYYDSQLSIWLSVDPRASSYPGLTPYNYCGNSPLNYTDPNGEFPIWAPVVIGAVIQATSYVVQVAVGNITWNTGQFFLNMGMGAVSGAISAGIGAAFGPAGSTLLGSAALNEVARAASHGVAGIITSGVMGNQPTISGFVSSCFSSLVGSATAGFHPAVQIGLSALTGGIAAEMTGGDFLQGFASGLIVAGLNHAAEGIETKVLQNQLNKVFANYPMDGNDEISTQEAFRRVSPAAEKLYLDGDPSYQNACATRLSLAFAKAGVKIPSGYGGLKDVNGNRIIISAQQMYNFMSTKYGALMTNYSNQTSTKGIYIGLTKPGQSYSGHVTIMKSGFNSNTFSSAMRVMYFWAIP